MTDDAERRWREGPRDPFEDLRRRLMQVERDQATLLRKCDEALERLNQVGLQIERDARERRSLSAAILLALIALGGLWFVGSGL